jgi:Ca2+-binding RTX toxin-like protein
VGGIDRLYGEDGDDLVFADGGDDTVDGGAGADTLWARTATRPSSAAPVPAGSRW